MVALVLGGGSARGIGHASLIRALEDVEIHIDIIGGTSIDGLVGGCYAKNMNLFETVAKTKAYAKRACSLWRQLFDLTYPLVAKFTDKRYNKMLPEKLVTKHTTIYFEGYHINRTICKCVGDGQIEDFWLPFFAITTKITYSRMESHTSGYTWRCIRTSMPLSGQASPLVDHGNMLMDSSYMDNLPVTIAKDMGADIIVTVDVSPPDQKENPIQYYKDSFNGWYALVHNHLNPFKSFIIPNMDQVQQRLASVLSVTRFQEAKATDGTLYTKLPVQHFDPTQFNQFNKFINQVTGLYIRL